MECLNCRHRVLFFCINTNCASCARFVSTSLGCFRPLSGFGGVEIAIPEDLFSIDPTFGSDRIWLLSRGTNLNTCQCCPLRTSNSHCRVCRAETRIIFVLTLMGIPNRFRRLYRHHLSTHPPITNITELTTIRSDGRVGALLITHP